MDSVLLSSKKMDYCTPQDFFDELDGEFVFALDAAATKKSAKCIRYFTPEDDELKQPWDVPPGYAVFCNPPYGRQIGEWVKKAYDESVRTGGTIVLLIPARTDTKYFHRYIYGKDELKKQLADARRCGCGKRSGWKMNGTLLDLVKELNTLSDDNLAARVIANSDVQWCLEELQDILEAEPTITIDNLIERLKECGTYGVKQEICQEVAEALFELQIELQAMRGAENSYKAELEKVKGERDRLIARTKGECWTCIRRYECNSRRGPHKGCWEFDEMLLKEHHDSRLRRLVT